jgi:exosortase
MSIHLASGDLRVGNPCSGVRSLLALFATGTLLAYLQPGGAWRRMAILFGSIPIALLGNATRLVLVILAAERRGVVWASGTFHDLTGYVVYALALGGLIGLRALLTPRAAGRDRT